MEENKTEERYWEKIWEFGVKSRYLSGNKKTKDTKWDCKSLALSTYDLWFMICSFLLLLLLFIVRRVRLRKQFSKTVIPTRRSQWKRSWLDEIMKIRKRTINIAMRDRHIFLHLFFLFMACLKKRPWFYLQIWLDSWQQKQKNQFWSFCSCNYTHLWFVEII